MSTTQTPTNTDEMNHMTITKTLEAIEKLPKGERHIWLRDNDPVLNGFWKHELTTDDFHQLAEHVRKLEESLRLGLGNIRLAEEFEIDLGRGWQQFAEQARQVVKEQQ